MMRSRRSPTRMAMRRKLVIRLALGLLGGLVLAFGAVASSMGCRGRRARSRAGAAAATPAARRSRALEQARHEPGWICGRHAVGGQPVLAGGGTAARAQVEASLH
jgi:hypothetical protein